MKRIVVVADQGRALAYVSAIADHPDIAAIVAVVAPTAHLLSRFDRVTVEVVPTVTEVLQRVEFDLAIVGEAADREHLVVPLLKAQKPTLVMAPLADSLQAAQRCVTLSQRAGTSLAFDARSVLGHSFLGARQCMKERRLGAVHTVNAQMLTYPPRGLKGTDRQRYGMLDGVDWLYHLHQLAEADPTKVFAQSMADVTFSPSADVWNHVFVEFENGVRATLLHSYLSQFHRCDCLVECENGGLEITSRHVSLIQDREQHPAPVWDNPFYADPSYSVREAYRILAGFIDAVDAGEPCSHDARHYLPAMAMMEAAYIPADRGEMINVQQMLHAEA